MEEKVSINSKSILDYIMFKLDKIDNEFTLEELSKIDEITIDYKDDNVIIFEELLFLKNLKTLNIRHSSLFNSDFNILLNLNKLENLYFEKCEFENADLISSLNLKNLFLINCNINNHTFLCMFSDLEELSVINGNIEISKINKLKKLKYLRLSYSKIIDNDNLSLENIRELYLDNTNIIDLSFINNLPHLNKIVISLEQYKNNKQLLKGLKNKVQVYDENNIPFQEE